MTLRERFGCFFLIVGTAVFAVFAVPVWNSLVGGAGKLPSGWLWTALVAALAAWAGWRLWRSGRRGVPDERPPSLARSIYNRMRSGRDDQHPPAA